MVTDEHTFIKNKIYWQEDPIKMECLTAKLPRSQEQEWTGRTEWEDMDKANYLNPLPCFQCHSHMAVSPGNTYSWPILLYETQAAHCSATVYQSGAHSQRVQD